MQTAPPENQPDSDQLALVSPLRGASRHGTNTEQALLPRAHREGLFQHWPH